MMKSSVNGNGREEGDYCEQGYMEVKQFNYRIGSIEARVESRNTLVIVQWDESMCWTIVNFTKDSNERWNAIFVGDRPLADRVDWMDLRKIMMQCFAFLAPDEMEVR